MRVIAAEPVQTARRADVFAVPALLLPRLRARTRIASSWRRTTISTVPSEVHSVWISARRNLIDAMRMDVSVDRERAVWAAPDDEDAAAAIT